MRYEYNDGGRRAAGFKSRKDCVCRAISLATAREYFKVRCELAHLKEAYCGEYSGGNGIHGNNPDVIRYMNSLGFVYVKSTCLMRIDDLPTEGTFVVLVPRHAFCLKDGVIYDDHMPKGLVEAYYRRLYDL